MAVISCPECGSFAYYPVTDIDDDGLCEYRCSDCGSYFVDEGEETEDDDKGIDSVAGDVLARDGGGFLA